MPRTRLSLFYLVGYLSAGGVALVVAPQTAMKLLLAQGNYPDLMLRMLGTFMLALGFIVLQIIGMLLVMFFPAIALWMPKALGG